MSSRSTALLLLAATAAPTFAAIDFNRDAYAWRESALCYAVTGEAYWWTRGRTRAITLRSSIGRPPKATPRKAVKRA